MGVTAQHHRQVTGIFGGGWGENRKTKVPSSFSYLFFSYATLGRYISLSSLFELLEDNSGSGFTTFTEHAAT